MSRGSHAECCENGSRVSRSWGLKWRLDSEREREGGGKGEEGTEGTKDGGDEEEVPAAT